MSNYQQDFPFSIGLRLYISHHPHHGSHSTFLYLAGNSNSMQHNATKFPLMSGGKPSNYCGPMSFRTLADVWSLSLDN